jgi:hypothetical protein
MSVSRHRMMSSSLLKIIMNPVEVNHEPGTK